MEEKKKGGKRNGAGRKPTNDPKLTITLYVKRSDVLFFGSDEKIKSKIYDFIFNYCNPPIASITPDVFNGNQASMRNADELPPKAIIKRGENYFLAIIKEGFEFPQEHADFIKDVQESDLPERKKQELISASRIKQS